MKILFVHNYYTQFLKYFFSKNKEKIDHINYESYKNLLFDELFGISDFFSQGVIANNHNAIDVVANDWKLQGRWAQEHGFKIRTYPPILLQSRIGQRLFLHSWMDKILELQIQEYRPDVVYFFDIESFTLEFLRFIKKRRYMIVAQKASPILTFLPYTTADIVFSSLPNLVEFFKKKHIRSHYLPFAFDKSILTKIPKQKKVYECTFIGGLSNRHKIGTTMLLDASEQIHIDIFGYGKQLLPRYSQAYKYHHGEVWGKDMYKVIMQSKMTINRHVDIAGDYANNMRLYEATGCGTMLLTDKKKNLGEFFVDGKEVISYTNADDLYDKIRYYSDYPKERDRITKAGQRRTLKDHTYVKRMKKVLQILNSLR